MAKAPIPTSHPNPPPSTAPVPAPAEAPSGAFVPWFRRISGCTRTNEHFFVVGTIEDADPSAFRKAACRAPEKIMFQFLGAWLFETKNFATFGIDSRHDVPDRAIFAGRVHALKNQQQCIAVGRVVKLLQGSQLSNMFFQKVLIYSFFDWQNGFTIVGNRLISIFL
jgi:hypothetical protein